MSDRCRATMLLLLLLGLLLASVHSETVGGSASPPRVSEDSMSGEPPGDAPTKEPFEERTEQTFILEYDGITQSTPFEEEEGVLGPGAITAIVIAVFLGASVLLAIIVIALRKFTAS